MAFWFNVSTGQVEDDANKGPQDRLMGPFDSRAEAEQALSHAKENTERWDAQDKAWDDEGLED
ncbi:MAG: methionine aminopeptidase [Dermatophilaceae bacterium]